MPQPPRRCCCSPPGAVQGLPGPAGGKTPRSTHRANYRPVWEPAASFGVLCDPTWPGTPQARPPHGWHCCDTAVSHHKVPHGPQGQMVLLPSSLPRPGCAHNPKLKVLVPRQRNSSRSRCCRKVTGCRHPGIGVSGPALMDIASARLMINHKANKHNSWGWGRVQFLALPSGAVTELGVSGSRWCSAGCSVPQFCAQPGTPCTASTTLSH